MRELDSDVAAIVADPPYGISYVHGGNDDDSNPTKFAGIAVIGDDKPFDPTPFLRFPEVILWGANHYADRLPSSAGWLVWDKRAATVVNDHSDCELAWSNVSGTARVFYHIWDGFRRGSETGIPRVHPTQKPICLMEWCIAKTKAETILDPFCGSGTTLVAAKKLGRHFLGFEISPEYCQVARNRLARIEAQPTLFQPKPEQMPLTESL